MCVQAVCPRLCSCRYVSFIRPLGLFSQTSQQSKMKPSTGALVPASSQQVRTSLLWAFALSRSFLCPQILQIQKKKTTWKLVALAHRTVDVVCTSKHKIQKALPKALWCQWWCAIFSSWSGWMIFYPYIQIQTNNYNSSPNQNKLSKHQLTLLMQPPS